MHANSLQWVVSEKSWKQKGVNHSTLYICSTSMAYQSEVKPPYSVCSMHTWPSHWLLPCMLSLPTLNKIKAMQMHNKQFAFRINFFLAYHNDWLKYIALIHFWINSWEIKQIFIKLWWNGPSNWKTWKEKQMAHA